MSRSKVSILSKYVMAIAILALLFSVAITTARYAVESYGSSSIGIESFDVDVKLYDENRNEVSGDITLDDTTEDLSSYTKVYYLDINNNDKDILYYKIEEQSGNFCFKVGEETTRYTTYGGSLDATTSTELTLTLSVHPDITINTGETQSLSISLYAEYQHTEEYASVEVEEPEPDLDDENHQSTDGWTGLSNSNISSYTSLSSGTYKFYLAEDITLGSNYFNWSGVSATVCLNNHTLSGSDSYVFNLTSNSSLTIEDCIGNGKVTSSSSSTQVVYISDGSTLTLTSGSISGGSAQYAVCLQSSSATLNVSGSPVIEKGTTGGVYLPSGATINLAGELQEGASIGVTSATSITGSNSVQISSTETSTYYYESAIKYIHSDNSSYKVSINHASNGYLTLLSTNYVNINVALHYTNGDSYSNTIYLNGDGAAWLSDNLTLSSYSGTYAYNSYVQYGAWEVSSATHKDFGFVIGTNTDNLWYYGFAKDSNLNISWSTSNYNLWGTQYAWRAQNDEDSSVWGCNFSESSLYQTMQAIGDWTIVLELNPSSINNSSTNNIVSNAYFVVDGVQQNLVS